MSELLPRLLQPCRTCKHRMVPCDDCQLRLQAADEIERLRAENERRYDRIKQLIAAIEEHQLDVWGTGPVGHDRDAELYAVLEREVSDE